MKELIDIRLQELNSLREDLVKKQQEDLMKIDVRIEELKGMLGDSITSSPEVSDSDMGSEEHPGSQGVDNDIKDEINEEPAVTPPEASTEDLKEEDKKENKEYVKPANESDKKEGEDDIEAAVDAAEAMAESDVKTTEPEATTVEERAVEKAEDSLVETGSSADDALKELMTEKEEPKPTDKPAADVKVTEEKETSEASAGLNELIKDDKPEPKKEAAPVKAEPPKPAATSKPEVKETPEPKKEASAPAASGGSDKASQDDIEAMLAGMGK